MGIKKFLVMFLIFNFNLLADSVESYSEDQLYILAKSKMYGYQYDVQYTMAAIASIESEAGLDVINVDSEDFGIWQNNIKSVLSRHSLKKTSANKNRFASKLVKDERFAAQETIDELRFWMKVHGKDWRKIWSSYNCGYNYDSKKAVDYASKIRKKIAEIKKFENKNGRLEDRFHTIMVEKDDMPSEGGAL